MELIYKGSSVYYEKIGNGKNHILFLHGWGGSTLSFKYVINYLQDYTAVFIDFPPFGKSEEPSTVYTIFDYALITKKIIQTCSLKSYTIVGHSFGGRVAQILASYDIACHKLLLVDSAGIKPKKTIILKLKLLKNKLIKKFLKNKNLGSDDYKKLSSKMKKTFVNIVNKDLSNFSKKINCKTLIIWGKKDKDTPLYMAKKLNKLIKDSELIIFKNAGHFSYLDCSSQFIYFLKYFIKV